MDSQIKCEMCICPADDIYIITATTRAWICSSCAKDCGGLNKPQQKEKKNHIKKWWRNHLEELAGRKFTDVEFEIIYIKLEAELHHLF